MTARRRERSELAILVAVGAAVWASSAAGVFQFDDFAAIVRAGGNAPIVTPSGALALPIRPLTELTFAIERLLFGAEPFGYHLLSIALHLASTLLVWRIARGLSEPKRRDARASDPFAFAAAMLFLVHPLATEAVTYLSGRASLLSACLALASVERWQRMRALEGDERTRRGALAASLAAFALALGAKETAAAAPLLLVLVDTPGVRAAAVQRRWRDYLPHTLVLALFLGAAAALSAYPRLLAHSLALRGPLENLALQPRLALEALALYVAPWRLNFDHDLRAEALGGWLAPAVVLAGAAIALVALRRGSRTALGALWFLAAFLPAGSVVARNDLLSERNLYLPSVGLALAAAALAVGAADRVPAPRRRVARACGAAAGAALVLALGVATVARNALYADPVALWRDVARKSPEKARAHANLGWSLDVAGELDAALDCYRRALRLEPGDPLSRRNLERAWLEKRRRESRETVGHLTAPSGPPAE